LIDKKKKKKVVCVISAKNKRPYNWSRGWKIQDAAK
jgi:hypothetical protein